MKGEDNLQDSGVYWVQRWQFALSHEKTGSTQRCATTLCTYTLDIFVLTFDGDFDFAADRWWDLVGGITLIVVITVSRHILNNDHFAHMTVPQESCTRNMIRMHITRVRSIMGDTCKQCMYNGPLSIRTPFHPKWEIIMGSRRMNLNSIPSNVALSIVLSGWKVMEFLNNNVRL